MTRRTERLRRWAARERAWRYLTGRRRPQHRVAVVTHRLLDGLAVFGYREDLRLRRIVHAYNTVQRAGER
ncbi:hypothetical protein [Nocardia sp. alder85J]|uniref:hypothetical protein n=1 Tax=Nocardia sp. alder85J TaxID=2862949 RepID=UPI001CD7A0B5|nr:hypothetical protein [Nocardia sp. alder85J]MCX4099070.1 hypothetical protein [Nocardia sp. alder85J]